MMTRATRLTIISILLLILIAGCATQNGSRPGESLPGEPDLVLSTTHTPTLPTSTPVPTSTTSITPTPTQIVFEIGEDLTIDHLREQEITGSPLTIEERLGPGYNYQRYLASYQSEGNTIYGLLTVPYGEPPEGGFKAIVFNHGYIPPDVYNTLERYTGYVDYLARSGFVVFKIDYRGHGRSEGFPSGSYFSPGYTIDALSALKSLQTLDYVDPQGIGMWGHSMAGNLVLRAMLVEPDVKAGVIWAGAVYSYEDFTTYGISDNTYRPPATVEGQDENEVPRRSRMLFDIYGTPELTQPFWQAVSLTSNLDYLTAPLQLHHAEDDPVVNIAYSYGLAEQLQLHRKVYEFYIYESGGHNIISPYFDQAMQRTVQFFQDNL